MKLFSLLSLTLMLLVGCADTTTTDTTADTNGADTDRYEVSRPVLDNEVPDANPDDSSMATDDAIGSSGTISPETGLESDLSPTTNEDSTTPFDQNENQADIDLTANIRSQVTDTEMSVAAQNVEIVTQNGKVTLSGDVANQQEKDRIEEIAVKVAGEGNVVNQLKIDNE